MPKMVTVRRDAAGRWFVSFMVEETVASLPKTGTQVGVDVGIKTLAVASDGWEAPNPRHLARHLRALKRASRALSRKVGAKRGQKRSGRFVHQQQRVARLHAKVADARRDYLHKATTALVKSHDLIAVEDLHVKGMVRNRRLARHLGDAALGELRRQLTYKAEWYGRELAVIDRWAPSSKTCSVCQAAYDGTMTLAVRDWTCRVCGTHHDRDLNAARNILAFALGAGGPEVMRVEGDTHRETPEGSGVERHPVKREEAATRAGLHGAGP
jgi:putative transposase